MRCRKRPLEAVRTCVRKRENPFQTSPQISSHISCAISHMTIVNTAQKVMWTTPRKALSIDHDACLRRGKNQLRWKRGEKMLASASSGSSDNQLKEIVSEKDSYVSKRPWSIVLDQTFCTI